MYISSSNIGMDSARRYSSVRKGSVSYNVFFAKGKGTNGLLNGELSGNNTAGKEEGSKRAESNLQARYSQARAVSNNRLGPMEDALDKIRESCMQHLLEMLFGKGRPARETVQSEEGVSNTQADGDVLQFHSVEEVYYKETEQTSFSTQGKVVTADGREITFDLNLEMSRSFEAYYRKEVSWQQPVFTDPLVINLGSDIASVSDQTFFFDLDADGTKEEISTLGEGSGYLSLDINGDGIINDGNELFGTKNGDGFADLAKYDSDGNGWIDENDPIFEKLKIWVKDQDGKDTLYSLKDKGVGAICLQKVATDFALNESGTNRAKAAIRSTGIFLYENGMAGTVQHLDMAR